MAGGAVGVLVHRFAPFPTADAGAYALVGMGTLFAGIIRAPMTSVFMIFELTQDYQVLVPLMIANMISYLISTRYQPVPLYRALLLQDQVHLPEPGTQLAAGAWRAKDLMTTDFKLIPPDLSIEEAARVASEIEGECLLVGEDGRYTGIVMQDQIRQALQSGKTEALLSALVVKEYEHVHPAHRMPGARIKQI